MISRFINNFKKKDLTLPDFYITDLHSHLIPGIDDGVKTLQESIEIIKQMKTLGFKKLITTPHIKQGKFPNTEKGILDSYESLKNELQKQNIDIKLDIGAEYYYDEYFVDKLRNKELLTFSQNYVLFEFSSMHEPFGLEKIVNEAQNAGYKLVLAHPERYQYYSNNLEKYSYLKDIGLLFQINLNSLTQYYGKKAQKASKYLVNKGLVDFIGSDIHNINQLNMLEDFIKTSTLNKMHVKNKIKNSYL